MQCLSLSPYHCQEYHMQHDPPHILFLDFLWHATVTAERAAVKKRKETKGIYTVVLLRDHSNCILRFDVVQICRWTSTFPCNMLPPVSALKELRLLVRTNPSYGGTAYSSGKSVSTYKPAPCQKPRDGRLTKSLTNSINIIFIPFVPYFVFSC
jgi:hypothetical protein